LGDLDDDDDECVDWIHVTQNCVHGTEASDDKM